MLYKEPYNYFQSLWKRKKETLSIKKNKQNKSIGLFIDYSNQCNLEMIFTQKLIRKLNAVTLLVIDNTSERAVALLYLQWSLLKTD